MDFEETDSRTRIVLDDAYHVTVGIGEPDERGAALVRERFLLSVIVHLTVLIVLVTNPGLLDRLFPKEVVEVKPPPKEVTLLYTPPPELKPKLKAPPLPAPPPPPKPKIETPPEPKPQPQPQVQVPVTPRLPQPPAPPPELPKQPGLGGKGDELEAKQLPPIGIPDFKEPAREPPPQAPEPAKPKIEALPQPKETPDSSQARLKFPVIPQPGRTEAILRGLARNRANKGGGGVLNGAPEFDPDNPNMSIPGPQILSDTMGVDFQPYLLRVYLLVRRNWYSVIPEIARLGKQGRVALEFSIERNGRVPDLTLRVSSGTDSLDSAALASIRLSNPFPALPQEFPGDNIRLRFIYLYNIPIGAQ